MRLAEKARMSLRTATFGKLAGANIALGAASVVQVLTGIIRNKILALTVGPAGVGLIAQLFSFQTTLALVGQQGIPQGILRYLPEAKALAPQNVMSIIKTALLAVTLGSVLITIVSLIIAPVLSISLLGDINAMSFVRIVTVGSTFMALTVLGESVLQSLQQATSLAIARILSALSGILLLIVLVELYQLSGAVWNLLAQALVGSLIIFVISQRNVKRNGFTLTTGSYSLAIYKDLFKVASTVLVTLFITTSTLLLVRTLIIHNLGLDQHGFFQATWGFTSLSIQSIVSAMTSYTLPKVAETQSSIERSKIINESITYCLVVMALIAWGSLSLRSLVVTTFYSVEFTPAASLFPAKIAGDVVYLMLWAMGTPLLPMNRLRAFILLHTTNACFLVIGAILFLPLIGLQGTVLSYFIANTVSLIIYLIDMYLVFNFRLSRLNLVLLVGLLGSIGIFGLLL